MTPDADSPHAPGKPKVRTFTWNGEGEMPEGMRDMLGDLHIEGLEGLQGMQGLEGLHEMHGTGPGGKKHVQVFVNGGRGRLGVRVESLNDDMASALGMSGGKGVLVIEVLGGTPAEKAGLRSGDVITTVEGKPVYDADDLVSALRDDAGVGTHRSVGSHPLGLLRHTRAALDCLCAFDAAVGTLPRRSVSVTRAADRHAPRRPANAPRVGHRN